MRLKKSKLVLTATAAAAVGLTISATSATNQQPNNSSNHKIYQIYPTVKSITYADNKKYLLSKEVNLVFEKGIDEAVKSRIKEALQIRNLTVTESHSFEDSDGKTNILVGTTDNTDTYIDKKASLLGLDFNASLKSRNDSYILSSKHNYITLLAKNNTAAFYGATTFWHILNQLDGDQIETFNIQDYSDVKLRGVFSYNNGTPWDLNAKIDFMKWGSYYKLNSYLYFDKDDQKTRDQWKTEYTSDELTNKFSKLIQESKKTKINLVYMLDPFDSNDKITVANYDENLSKIKTKFEQLITAGIRKFGLFAENQPFSENTSQQVHYETKILNDLITWLKEKQQITSDLSTNLIYAPANRNTTITSNSYANFTSEVEIINSATGTYAGVHNTSLTTFKTTTNKTPVAWVNWPNNSDAPAQLILGGYKEFFGTDVTADNLQGVLINPMQQAQASKIAAFAAANFGWKIWRNDTEINNIYQAAFSNALNKSNIFDIETQSYLKLAKHIKKPDISNYPSIDESEEIQTKIDAFKTNLASNHFDKIKAEALITDFHDFEKAASILKTSQNAEFNKEMSVYLDTFINLSQTAKALLLSVIKKQENSSNDFISYYNRGIELLNELKTTHKITYNGQSYDAIVGSSHLMPFLDWLVSWLKPRIESSLFIPPIKLTQTFITNLQRQDSLGKGGTDTVFYKGNPYQVILKNSSGQLHQNDYFGVEFNQPITLKSLQVKYLGLRKDYFINAKVQYQTSTNSSWTDVNGWNVNVTSANQYNPIVLNNQNIANVTKVRLINNDTTPRQKWVRLQEFVINSGELTSNKTWERYSHVSYNADNTTNLMYLVYQNKSTDKMFDDLDSTGAAFTKVVQGKQGSSDVNVGANIPRDATVGFSLDKKQWVSHIYINQSFDSATDLPQDAIIEYKDEDEKDTSRQWKQFGSTHLKWGENSTVVTGYAHAKDFRIKNTSEVQHWWRIDEIRVFLTNNDRYNYTTADINRLLIHDNKGPNLMFDGDDHTFAWLIATSTGGSLSQNDGFDINFSNPKNLKSIRLLYKYVNDQNPGAGDRTSQISIEKKINNVYIPWKTYDLSGDDITINISKADNFGTVTGLRLRTLKAENFGFNINTIAFTENKQDSTDYVYSENAAVNDLLAKYDGYDTFELYHQKSPEEKQDITLKANERIGLDLSKIQNIQTFNKEYDNSTANSNALKLQYSDNGYEWVDAASDTIAANTKARYIALFNSGSSDLTLSFKKITVTVENLALNPKFDSTDITQNPQTERNNELDGSVFTYDQFGPNINANNYIIYDLGRQTDIKSLRLYTQDDTSDYPRDMDVQVSSDKSSWHTVFSIGDTTTDADSTTILKNVATGSYDSKYAVNPKLINDHRYPGFKYWGNDSISNQKARYIKILIKANYPSNKKLKINEIVVNHNKIQQPNYTSNYFLGTKYEPTDDSKLDFLHDKDLSTYYQPKQENGELIYTIDDKSLINKHLRILTIESNSLAKVYYRKENETNTFHLLGTLTNNLNEFILPQNQKVVQIKIAWETKRPKILEVYDFDPVQVASVSTDKTALQNEVNKVDPSDYNLWTEASRNEFLHWKTTATNALKQITEANQSKDQSYTQASLDAIKDALIYARDHYNKKVDLTLVQHEITNKALNNPIVYTSESYQEYENKISSVQSQITHPENLSQHQVDAFYRDILNKKAALIKQTWLTDLNKQNELIKKIKEELAKLEDIPELVKLHNKFDEFADTNVLQSLYNEINAQYTRENNQKTQLKQQIEHNKTLFEDPEHINTLTEKLPKTTLLYSLQHLKTQSDEMLAQEQREKTDLQTQIKDLLSHFYDSENSKPLSEELKTTTNLVQLRSLKTKVEQQKQIDEQENNLRTLIRQNITNLEDFSNLILYNEKTLKKTRGVSALEKMYTNSSAAVNNESHLKQELKVQIDEKIIQLTKQENITLYTDKFNKLKTTDNLNFFIGLEKKIQETIEQEQKEKLKAQINAVLTNLELETHKNEINTGLTSSDTVAALEQLLQKANEFKTSEDNQKAQLRSDITHTAGLLEIQNNQDTINNSLPTSQTIAQLQSLKIQADNLKAQEDAKKVALNTELDNLVSRLQLDNHINPITNQRQNATIPTLETLKQTAEQYLRDEEQQTQQLKNDINVLIDQLGKDSNKELIRNNLSSTSQINALENLKTQAENLVNTEKTELRNQINSTLALLELQNHKSDVQNELNNADLSVAQLTALKNKAQGFLNNENLQKALLTNQIQAIKSKLEQTNHIQEVDNDLNSSHTINSLETLKTKINNFKQEEDNLKFDLKKQILNAITKLTYPENQSNFQNKLNTTSSIANLQTLLNDVNSAVATEAEELALKAQIKQVVATLEDPTNKNQSKYQNKAIDDLRGRSTIESILQQAQEAKASEIHRRDQANNNIKKLLANMHNRKIADEQESKYHPITDLLKLEEFNNQLIEIADEDQKRYDITQLLNSLQDYNNVVKYNDKLLAATQKVGLDQLKIKVQAAVDSEENARATYTSTKLPNLLAQIQDVNKHSYLDAKLQKLKNLYNTKNLNVNSVYALEAEMNDQIAAEKQEKQDTENKIRSILSKLEKSENQSFVNEFLNNLSSKNLNDYRDFLPQVQARLDAENAEKAQLRSEIEQSVSQLDLSEHQLQVNNMYNQNSTIEQLNNAKNQAQLLINKETQEKSELRAEIAKLKNQLEDPENQNQVDTDLANTSNNLIKLRETKSATEQRIKDETFEKNSLTNQIDQLYNKLELDNNRQEIENKKTTDTKLPHMRVLRERAQELLDQEHAKKEQLKQEIKDKINHLMYPDNQLSNRASLANSNTIAELEKLSKHIDAVKAEEERLESVRAKALEEAKKLEDPINRSLLSDDFIKTTQPKDLDELFVNVKSQVAKEEQEKERLKAKIKEDYDKLTNATEKQKLKAKMDSAKKLVELRNLDKEVYAQFAEETLQQHLISEIKTIEVPKLNDQNTINSIYDQLNEYKNSTSLKILLDQVKQEIKEEAAQKEALKKEIEENIKKLQDKNNLDTYKHQFDYAKKTNNLNDFRALKTDLDQALQQEEQMRQQLSNNIDTLANQLEDATHKTTITTKKPNVTSDLNKLRELNNEAQNLIKKEDEEKDKLHKEIIDELLKFYDFNNVINLALKRKNTTELNALRALKTQVDNAKTEDQKEYDLREKIKKIVESLEDFNHISKYNMDVLSRTNGQSNLQQLLNKVTAAQTKENSEKEKYKNNIKTNLTKLEDPDNIKSFNDLNTKVEKNPNLNSYFGLDYKIDQALKTEETERKQLKAKINEILAKLQDQGNIKKVKDKLQTATTLTQLRELLKETDNMYAEETHEKQKLQDHIETVLSKLRLFDQIATLNTEYRSIKNSKELNDLRSFKTKIDAESAVEESEFSKLFGQTADKIAKLHDFDTFIKWAHKLNQNTHIDSLHALNDALVDVINEDTIKFNIREEIKEKLPHLEEAQHIIKLNAKRLFTTTSKRDLQNFLDELNIALAQEAAEKARIKAQIDSQLAKLEDSQNIQTYTEKYANSQNSDLLINYTPLSAKLSDVLKQEEQEREQLRIKITSLYPQLEDFNHIVVYNENNLLKLTNLNDLREYYTDTSNALQSEKQRKTELKTLIENKLRGLEDNYNIILYNKKYHHSNQINQLNYYEALYAKISEVYDSEHSEVRLLKEQISDLLNSLEDFEHIFTYNTKNFANIDNLEDLRVYKAKVAAAKHSEDVQKENLRKQIAAKVALLEEPKNIKIYSDKFYKTTNLNSLIALNDKLDEILSKESVEKTKLQTQIHNYMPLLENLDHISLYNEVSLLKANSIPKLRVFLADVTDAYTSESERKESLKELIPNMLKKLTTPAYIKTYTSLYNKIENLNDYEALYRLLNIALSIESDEIISLTNQIKSTVKQLEQPQNIVKYDNNEYVEIKNVIDLRKYKNEVVQAKASEDKLKNEYRSKIEESISKLSDHKNIDTYTDKLDSTSYLDSYQKLYDDVLETLKQEASEKSVLNKALEDVAARLQAVTHISELNSVKYDANDLNTLREKLSYANNAYQTETQRKSYLQTLIESKFDRLKPTNEVAALKEQFNSNDNLNGYELINSKLDSLIDSQSIVSAKLKPYIPLASILTLGLIWIIILVVLRHRRRKQTS
ncbi:beta-N-acetylglucosaminidase domain-containing protein [Mycoplasma sp. 394]